MRASVFKSRLPERVARRQEIVVLLPRAGRALVVASVLSNLVSGLAPVAFIVATSILVGGVPAAVRGGWHSPGGHAVLRAAAAAGISLAMTEVMPLVAAAIGTVVTRTIDGVVRDRIADAATAAPVAALEDERCLNLLADATQALEQVRDTPGLAAAGMLNLIQQYGTSLGALVVVAVAFSPVAALILAVAAIGVRHHTRNGLVATSEAWMKSMPARREGWYFLGLGNSSAAAKEMRVFGLSSWAIARYHHAAARIHAAIWPTRRRVFLRQTGGYLALAMLLTTGVLIVVARDAVRGELSLRELLLVLQAGPLIMAGAAFNMAADTQTEFGMRSHRSLMAFERIVTAGEGPGDTPSPRIGGPAVANERVALLRDRICFEGVTFAYPGSTRKVFDGLDLQIQAGHSLGIVGLNGAGKTTLVKLLARLYDPDEGRITVDGTNIRDFNIAAWRAQLAPLFQDFVRFELPARDNIGFGALALAGDETALRRAAEKASALDLVEALPGGLATPLSPRFRGGVDLSGGQWQRVALARAMLAVEAGARVLILDEPTANVDVRMEASLYERFSTMVSNVTTLLISHRFSTVRLADSIAVIENGQVIEQGSHAQLLATPGRYAELFNLQAARFAAGDLLLDDGDDLTGPPA